MQVMYRLCARHQRKRPATSPNDECDIWRLDWRQGSPRLAVMQFIFCGAGAARHMFAARRAWLCRLRTHGHAPTCPWLPAQTPVLSLSSAGRQGCGAVRIRGVRRDRLKPSSTGLPSFLLHFTAEASFSRLWKRINLCFTLSIVNKVISITGKRRARAA